MAATTAPHKEQGALGELEYLQAKQAVIDAATRDDAS